MFDVGSQRYITSHCVQCEVYRPSDATSVYIFNVIIIEYILSPECLRDIKNRDKKPRRSRGFVEVFYKSRKHEGEVCILFKSIQ